MSGLRVLPRPPRRGPTSIERLIYVSASRLSPDPARAAAELGRILDASRRNNERDWITGTLLFAPAGFAQVLEGPPRAVEAAFARIAADRRHAHVKVLARGPARVRAFARWAMGAAGAATEDLGRLLARSDAAPGGAPADATSGVAAEPDAAAGEVGEALVALLRRALLAAEARTDAGGGADADAGARGVA